MTNTTNTQSQDIIETVKSQFAQLAQEFEECKADFVERFQTNPADALSWRASNMVKAQVQMELGAETLDMIERACGDDPKDMKRFFGDAEPPAREIERVLVGLREAQRRFNGQLMRRNLFGYGSSPDDNLVEMAKAKATADFLDGYKMWTLKSLIAYAESFLAAEAKETAEAKAA